jgi:RNA polymerase sigma-70 factor (ECF subfamily)
MNTTMPDETRERQLVERARNGDQPAFAEVFTALRERLLATIRARLSPEVRQRIDPEDVLQDTFVRALHSVKRFEWQGEDSFRRWLESVATHVALDAVRHHGRRKALQIDREPEAPGASPSKAMRREERFERLKKSMEALSPDYRTVLEFSRIEGLSVREVAERMSRSESAVKSLLLQATRQLKHAFGDTESLGLGGHGLEGTAGTEDTGGTDGR